MSPTQSIDLSANALLPDLGTGTRVSTWFSFCRNNYSRGRGGQSLGPIASDFRAYWPNSFRIQPSPLTTISQWTLNDYIVWLRDHFQCIHYGWQGHTRTYCQILAAFNEYVAGIRAFEPYRRTQWQVNYISVVGNDYYYANRMEAKFHGRCLLNLSVESWNVLNEAIGRNDMVVFWNRIVQIYNNSPYNRRLANPSYLREAQRPPTPAPAPRPRQNTRRTTRRTSYSAPYRNPYSTNSPDWLTQSAPPAPPPPPATLLAEYTARQNPADLDVFSNAELARMIINASNLPSASKKTIYDMIMAAQLFDESDANFADTSV